jgi:glycosyltransferase involved in cell wall biosynthesis
MRILHLVNHIREIGNGVTNTVIDLACLQAKSGHKVLVVSAGGEYQELLASYGVAHLQLEHTGLKSKPIELIKIAWRYRAIVREFQPDIVHAHQTPGVTLARFFRAGLRYGLVSSVQCVYEKGARAMGWADRVIVVSDAVAQSVQEFGVPQTKLRIVYNGTLGSPRIRPPEECRPISLEQPSITTAAGMFHRKGIFELIEAFAKIALDFPEAHLYLIGEGPDRSVFQEQAQQTSVSSRIHFIDFQPDLKRYLLATDIFVLASYRESFPLVIPEAREAGCAIVATAVDGTPEALDGGQAGLLVPPKDSQALAGALTQLLSSSEVLSEWKHRSQNNIEWLSLTRVNEETLNVYRELAAT